MRQPLPTNDSSDESDNEGSNAESHGSSDAYDYGLSDTESYRSSDTESCGSLDIDSYESPETKLTALWAEYEEDSDVELPPGYYVQQYYQTNEDDLKKQTYAESTTRALDYIEKQWYSCWETMWELEHQELEKFENVSLTSLSIFFDWRLGRRKTKEGRRLPRIKIKSSLETYWKLFRLVYTRATGKKLSDEFGRNMMKELRQLAIKHKLKEKGRDKACMYIEDQTLVLGVNLATTEKSYVHGRYRIQLQIYLQLGGFTTNRPQAILDLDYRHIVVTLLRDPEGGPNQVYLEFTYEFTKRYLGIKDLNTFPFPEIMYDDSLTFSVQTFVLGMLFHDQAFAAEHLTTPEALSRLTIPKGLNQLPLPLKKSLDDIPVFRKAIRTLYGWKISEKERLPYHTLLAIMKALGVITGFEQICRPYSLRYNGGKEMNENGNVSDAMQNLVMGHASMATFVRHYLSRRITLDTAAIMRRRTPQTAVIRAASTMSRTIDHRRPRKLTLEQSQSVNKDRKIRLMLQERTWMKCTYEGATKMPEYKKLNREINRRRQRLRRERLETIKKNFKNEQAVRDIERQLAGLPMEEATEVISAPMAPAQKELHDAIYSVPGTCVDEEKARRDRAIHAVAVYCGIEEGGMNSARTKQRKEKVTTHVKTQSECEKEVLEAAKISVFKEWRPRICFMCLGEERLPTKDRTYSFYTSGDLTKHFKRKHINNIGAEEFLSCKICQLDLESKEHLQRHALQAHGTIS